MTDLVTAMVEEGRIEEGRKNRVLNERECECGRRMEEEEGEVRKNVGGWCG